MLSTVVEERKVTYAYFDFAGCGVGEGVVLEEEEAVGEASVVFCEASSDAVDDVLQDFV